MDEKTRDEIIRNAELLQQGIDRKLEETEEDDYYTLQNWQESYGETAEFAQKVQQAQHRQRLRQIKRDKPFMQALRKRGLTAETFVELEQKNPQAFQETYAEGVERFLDRLQGKGSKPKDRFFETTPLQPHPDRQARAREIARKGKADDKMIDDLIGALLFDD
jgi:hypothetical protein